MGIALNPYLNFRGNAREAMEFYKGVFGGDLTISTFGELHASSEASEDDLVMHSVLEGQEGIAFMASDVPDRMEYTPGTNSFSMSLSGDDEARLRGYYDQLSDGGSVSCRSRRPPGATPSGCAATGSASAGSSTSWRRRTDPAAPAAHAPGPAWPVGLTPLIDSIRALT
jgi:PhnB protein